MWMFCSYAVARGREATAGAKALEDPEMDAAMQPYIDRPAEFDAQDDEKLGHSVTQEEKDGDLLV